MKVLHTEVSLHFWFCLLCFFFVVFWIFFTLTIFFPFVTLLGEWEEKLWENDFSLFK